MSIVFFIFFYFAICPAVIWFRWVKENQKLFGEERKTKQNKQKKLKQKKKEDFYKESNMAFLEQVNKIRY